MYELGKKRMDFSRNGDSYGNGETGQTMAETTTNSKGTMQPEPELVRDNHEPMGVLQEESKAAGLSWCGGCLLIVAAVSQRDKQEKLPRQQAAERGTTLRSRPYRTTPDNNVQDLKNQTAAAEQAALSQPGLRSPGDPALANATAAQQAAAAATYTPTGQVVPCVPGQHCLQTNIYGQQGGQSQISPQEQEAQQLAAKERELAYNSRFASNLVYTHQPDTAALQQAPAGPEGATVAGSQQVSNSAAAAPAGSSLVAPRPSGDQPSPATAQASIKRGPEVNIDSVVGQPYVIYEGLTMDTVLMNRLDGDSVGPVKVLVSNPVYSHDGQHVLVPEGAIVLGEAKKIGANGFGQQRRIAVTFHRMIMPWMDTSVDLGPVSWTRSNSVKRA